MYIKFTKLESMEEWAQAFQDTEIKGADDPLIIRPAKRDLISYNPKFFGPRYMRVYNEVWHIMKKEVEDTMYRVIEV